MEMLIYKKMLAEQLQLENALLEYIDDCLTEIFKEKADIAKSEFQQYYNCYSDQMFLPSIAYLKKQMQCEEN